MRKQKAFDILEYVVITMIIIVSIFEIITLSLKIDDLIATGDPISITILGIVCFSVVLVISLIVLYITIKRALYRSKFNKNY